VLVKCTFSIQAELVLRQPNAKQVSLLQKRIPIVSSLWATLPFLSVTPAVLSQTYSQSSLSPRRGDRAGELCARFACLPFGSVSKQFTADAQIRRLGVVQVAKEPGLPITVHSRFRSS
jgi:hypothetical protein